MADQPLPLPVDPQDYRIAPRRFWSFITFTLLAVNFVFFGLEKWAGGWDNLPVLLNLGAAYGPYMRRGEYWRLVMPMFLHGGWLHILGNSYCLYILGPILERVYGYGRYATIYVAAGVGGAFLSMEVSRNISVGASGAIFGIAGAIVGYLAASASTRFELESLLARTVLTGVFVLVHNLCLAALQHALLEAPPPFQPIVAVSAVLVNVALGLIVFQILDRFRRPA